MRKYYDENDNYYENSICAMLSPFLVIYNAYDKYCEENVIKITEKTSVHEYLCYMLIECQEINIIPKYFIDDVSEKNYTTYFVNFCVRGYSSVEEHDQIDFLLFSFDSETCCIYFHDNFYDILKNDYFIDMIIEDKREFVKFLCEYKLSTIKQNQNIL